MQWTSANRLQNSIRNTGCTKLSEHLVSAEVNLRDVETAEVQIRKYLQCNLNLDRSRAR